jgi:glutamine phosphoribosylpyrophosphate amidotransferase
MCGIVGYVGRTVDGTALDVVMEGLARLEYRGYDSAGVALIDGDHVEAMTLLNYFLIQDTIRLSWCICKTVTIGAQSKKT